MDSPIGFMMMLLMAGALVFQLFFRYEHWTGGPHRDMTYERDNLTGETHTVRPGERVDFMARLLGNNHWGQHQEKGSSQEKTWLDTDPMRDEDQPEEGARQKETLTKEGQEEPVAMNMTASPTVQRAGAAPVPPTPDAKHDLKKHEMWESEDLNGDGRLEEVIQTQAADGMMDISVLSGSKELFYGRGKRLVVLPTRSQGWSDLQLKVSEQQTLRFRFNPNVDGYELGPSQR